jgi:hypothetical protein
MQFNCVVELCYEIVLLNCVVQFDCVVENLVERRKERKRTTCLFCFNTRNVRQFAYPRIMDGSGHMGGRDPTFGNGDYKREAMSNWVHNSTREVTS